MNTTMQIFTGPELEERLAMSPRMRQQFETMLCDALASFEAASPARASAAPPYGYADLRTDVARLRSAGVSDYAGHYVLATVGTAPDADILGFLKFDGAADDTFHAHYLFTGRHASDVHLGERMNDFMVAYAAAVGARGVRTYDPSRVDAIVLKRVARRAGAIPDVLYAAGTERPAVASVLFK